MASTGKARLATDSLNITLPKITDNSVWLYAGSDLLNKMRFARFIEFPALFGATFTGNLLPYLLGYAGLYIILLRVS